MRSNWVIMILFCFWIRSFTFPPLLWFITTADIIGTWTTLADQTVHDSRGCDWLYKSCLLCCYNQRIIMDKIATQSRIFFPESFVYHKVSMVMFQDNVELACHNFFSSSNYIFWFEVMFSSDLHIMCMYHSLLHGVI